MTKRAEELLKEAILIAESAKYMMEKLNDISLPSFVAPDDVVPWSRLVKFLKEDSEEFLKKVKDSCND